MIRPQLTFDLGHRPALGVADFLVAPCNEAAVAWLDRWPAWPGPALAIAGPPGCGKTHLVHAWLGRSGAPCIAAADLAGRDPFALMADRRAIAIEDADRGVDETALFHLLNVVAERRGTVVLTGRDSPARWAVRLADLRSRLAAAAVVSVAAPDDRLLAGVLAKQFADRQLKVADDVIAFLVPRMERSFAAARALVESLDRAALAERRPITVPFARLMLDGTASLPFDSA
ncbi:MAG: DNA replication protein [Alphaproteobacteria bacterium]|nr:DNA replication protein [Alphaproteobacteria bacterium]